MEIYGVLCYNYYMQYFVSKINSLLKRRISMSKKKIIVTASAAAICAVGITAATVIVCQRLFKKNYFTVSNENN